MPPTSKHNHASRQDDALISPQGVGIYVAMLIRPVLHHSHAMPTRYAVLGWQRVEVAGCQKRFVGIFTLTLEAEGYWITLRQDMGTSGSSLGSGSGSAVSDLGTRLEDLFEEGRPRFRILFGKVEAKVLCQSQYGWPAIENQNKTHLEGLIGIIATHVVWDWVVLVLSIAYENYLIVVDIGVAALPVFAKFQRGSGQGLGPRLWAFRRSQVIVADVSEFMLVKQVILEEVCDVQGPLDIDLLTVGALEDGAYRVRSVHQGLRVGEAPCFSDPRGR
jgi:hypothetical protein